MEMISLILIIKIQLKSRGTNILIAIKILWFKMKLLCFKYFFFEIILSFDKILKIKFLFDIDEVLESKVVFKANIFWIQNNYFQNKFIINLKYI